MIRYFARHHTAANLLMVAIAVMGLFSLSSIRRETFPDFQVHQVQVSVPYPGATPEDVEEGILLEIEDALDGVRFIEEIRAEAREGLGRVTVEMVEDGEWSAFKDEIDTAIAAIDSFPERAEPAVVEELNTLDPVMTVVVSGDFTAPDLKAHAEALKDRLSRLPDVGQVAVAGFSDQQLRVELDAAALARFGLDPSDVARRIRSQSVDLPAGTVESEGREILLRFDEERADAVELEDLVVLDSGDGGLVRVRDLGRVLEDFEREEDQVVHHPRNSQPRRAALLQVRKTETQDVLEVADAVFAVLEEERQRDPQVDLIVTQDTSSLVAQRLSLLIKNGWQGMILVFLAMWLFFSSRVAFWVVLSLPVSFFGAFYFMPQFDLTVNMLTLVGFLLGVGILMDDGIVIGENIAAHHERGKPPLQAAIDGVREVGVGVLSSFATTAAVFGPLMFLDGNIGRVLLVVPMIVLLVLSVSLIEAFLILPNHLGHALAKGTDPSRLRRWIERRFEWVKEHLLGRAVDALVRRRYLWLGVVLLVFLGTLSVPVRGWIEFQGLPTLDGNTAVARVLMPQGTPFERTRAVTDQVIEALERVDAQWRRERGSERPLTKIAYVQFDLNADANEQGTHVATVFAELLPSEERGITLDELYARWRTETGPVADVERLNFTEPSLGPNGRSIDIRASGDDLSRLRAAIDEIAAWIGPYPGVENLTPDLRPGKPELLVRTLPGSLGLELDATTLASQLRGAYQGEEALEVQIGGETVEVDAQYDAASRGSSAGLDRFQFVRADGSRVPFGAVATTAERVGWSRIARIDGRRTVSLLGDVDTRVGNTQSTISAFQSELLPELEERYPDVAFEVEGEPAETRATGRSFARALLIGVIGVYLLLSFQFKSYVEPLIVMAAIPMALIGVIWGHLLLGFPLTMPSILGFTSLAGVVVNDSILLVIFLRQARADGLDPVEAAGRASRQRFRAILITSLTTAAGLVPLMFETSLQAIILIPLAISIVFGILTSTVLVLAVIPSLYVILDDLGLSATHAIPD